MSELTTDQREELEALAEVNAVLGKPSFIARFHWREGYAALVRRGLVEWTDPPEGFDKRTFAGTHITAKGLAAINGYISANRRRERDVSVVDFPNEKVHPPVVSGREIWDQPEPPTEMVWEICPYTRSTTRDETRCHHCPQWEDDERYGRMQRGCYGMAAEACRIVFAMQTRGAVNAEE